jgi:transcriptional regulator with GAF, ATPase, and Fis domain
MVIELQVAERPARFGGGDAADLPSGVICRDARAHAMWRLVAQVAATESTVLVSGPTGAGKELVARTVHGLSARRERRLVAINCAAIPRDLLESELFGHERGAFTGAVAPKIGKFEFADGGTIFLDEIGCLPLDLQAKLLRVLQEREITRVGGLHTLRVDVRVVAATNVDLRSLVSRGEFREDLYYRLAVIPVAVPPLVERPEDILPLASHLLDDLAKRHGRPGLELDLAAEAALRSYAWPGNVRELANVMERMVVLARGRVLGIDDVPSEVRGTSGAQDPCSALRDARHAFERWLILRTLDQTNGRIGAAAEVLGVHRNTLHQKMDALGIAVLPRPARGCSVARATGAKP